MDFRSCFRQEIRCMLHSKETFDECHHQATTLENKDTLIQKRELPSEAKQFFPETSTIIGEINGKKQLPKSHRSVVRTFHRQELNDSFVYSTRSRLLIYFWQRNKFRARKTARCHAPDLVRHFLTFFPIVWYHFSFRH